MNNFGQIKPFSYLLRRRPSGTNDSRRGLHHVARLSILDGTHKYNDDRVQMFRSEPDRLRMLVHRHVNNVCTGHTALPHHSAKTLDGGLTGIVLYAQRVRALPSG